MDARARSMLAGDEMDRAERERLVLASVQQYAMDGPPLKVA